MPETVHDLLTLGGFDVTSSPSIRPGIWYKLKGNLMVNLLSARTGANSDRMLCDALVSSFRSAAMPRLPPPATGSAAPLTRNRRHVTP